MVFNYQKKLNIMKESQGISAEEIRAHIIRHHINPHRQRNEKIVKIRVGDVQHELELGHRPGSVYGAMGSKLFEDEGRVKRTSIEGSNNAPNAVFTFEILE